MSRSRAGPTTAETPHLTGLGSADSYLSRCCDLSLILCIRRKYTQTERERERCTETREVGADHINTNFIVVFQRRPIGRSGP